MDDSKASISGTRNVLTGAQFDRSSAQKHAPSRPVNPDPHPIAQRLAVVVEVLVVTSADVLRQHTSALSIQAWCIEVPIRLVRIPCPKAGHVDRYLTRSGRRGAQRQVEVLRGDGTGR